jgi:hypothetical protein
VDGYSLFERTLKAGNPNKFLYKPFVVDIVMQDCMSETWEDDVIVPLIVCSKVHFSMERPVKAAVSKGLASGCYVGDKALEAFCKIEPSAYMLDALQLGESNVSLDSIREALHAMSGENLFTNTKLMNLIGQTEKDIVGAVIEKLSGLYIEKSMEGTAQQSDSFML